MIDHHIFVVWMNKIQPSRYTSDIVFIDTKNLIQHFRGFPIIVRKICFIGSDKSSFLRFLKKVGTFTHCFFRPFQIGNVNRCNQALFHVPKGNDPFYLQEN